MGIALLGGILLILVALRMSMRYWVKPEPISNETELTAAWEKFKTEQSRLKAKAGEPVNINTADSATLVSVSGIGPKTAQKILDYRRRKGLIKDYQQLEHIYHFPNTVSKRLQEEIRFSDSIIAGK